jgi:hypothetical protein
MLPSPPAFRIFLILPVPVLVANMVISFWSVCFRWFISEVAQRITTEKDEIAFMLPAFLSIELFQALLYVTAQVQLNSEEFVITLAWQEFGSLLRNVEFLRVLTHRFRRVLKRETALDHRFATKKSTERIVSMSVVHAMAEFLGLAIIAGVEIAEKVLFAFDPTGVYCGLARCDLPGQYWDLLVLFGVVFLTRMLFWIGECRLLPRVISYYQGRVKEELVREQAAAAQDQSYEMEIQPVPVNYEIGDSILTDTGDKVVGIRDEMQGTWGDRDESVDDQRDDRVGVYHCNLLRILYQKRILS